MLSSSCFLLQTSFPTEFFVEIKSKILIINTEPSFFSLGEEPKLSFEKQGQQNMPETNQFKLKPEPQLEVRRRFDLFHCLSRFIQLQRKIVGLERKIIDVFQYQVKVVFYKIIETSYFYNSGISCPIQSKKLFYFKTQKFNHFAKNSFILFPFFFFFSLLGY